MCCAGLVALRWPALVCVHLCRPAVKGVVSIGRCTLPAISWHMHTLEANVQPGSAWEPAQILGPGGCVRVSRVLRSTQWQQVLLFLTRGTALSPSLLIATRRWRHTHLFRACDQLLKAVLASRCQASHLAQSGVWLFGGWNVSRALGVGERHISGMGSCLPPDSHLLCQTSQQCARQTAAWVE